MSIRPLGTPEEEREFKRRQEERSRNLRIENETKYRGYPKPVFTNYVLENGTIISCSSKVGFCPTCNNKVNTEGFIDINGIAKKKSSILSKAANDIDSYNKEIRKFSIIKKMLGNKNESLHQELRDCENRRDKDIMELNYYTEWLKNKRTYKCLDCSKIINGEIVDNPRTDREEIIDLNSDGSFRNGNGKFANNIFTRDIRL